MKLGTIKAPFMNLNVISELKWVEFWSVPHIMLLNGFRTLAANQNPPNFNELVHLKRQMK